MPKYKYIAKSLTGEPSSGTIEAKNEHEVARILRQEGYILISIEPGEKKGKKKLQIPLAFFRGVPLVDKIMFTRNLQVMISAGISLPRALKILAEQSRSRKLRKALLSISEEIIKGKNFSESLEKYPGIFPELFFSMVKVGEEAGTLEEVLGILTQQMEREHELKSKVKGAMVYPAVIIIAMIGIGILMLIVIVPKLAETFEELEIELPLTTRIVIGLGTFLANFWYSLPIIIIVFIVLLRAAFKTKTGKKIFDTLFIKIPVIAPIIIKVNSAYTVRTLSSLIASGVPIVRSLEITSGVLGNIHYKKAISEAAEEVKKGAKLDEVLRKYSNIYPELVVQMIAVGEETGETSSILEKLADFFEDEVTQITKNLSSIIEPIIMLIIGSVVGFFAVSMIQPIYSMVGAL